MQAINQLQEQLITDRKVRVVAQLGSYSTENAWAGSEPYLISFERRLSEILIEKRGGIKLKRFPYELLDLWRDWNNARLQAPLAELATSRVIYDPTGYYTRIQRTLKTLQKEQLAIYREELLDQANDNLQTIQQNQDNAGSSAQNQLLTLIKARNIAVKLLYPALLTHIHDWPEFEIRLPHVWRIYGLRFPKAIYHLETLYGFGGIAEARRVMLATRGFGLIEQEKRARTAFQAGYYDGVVCFLRNETARIHSADLEKWSYLTSARREKLAILIGITLSPLGPAATTIIEELIQYTRIGQ